MSAGELFGAITRTVSEPMLLVGISGTILGANAAMLRTFPGVGTGSNLHDLTTDDAGDTAETLWRWARCGAPLVGALALRDADGGSRHCHCFGARAAWVADAADEPVVQVRLVPSAHRGNVPRRAAAFNERERYLRARLQREHEVVAEVQRSFLPDHIDGTPLKVAVDYRPTVYGAEVGGDWYDVFGVPHTERVALAIGDVAGHRLSEAMIMAELRSVLRAAALEEGARADHVVSRVDHYVDTYLPASMATVCYLVYEPEEQLLTYANAGHVPPLLLRPDGRCAPLDAVVDPPLGCSMGTGRNRDQTVVGPGDMLILYTDGVVERRGESLDIGLGELADLLTGLSDPGPTDVCSAIMEWSSGIGHADDRAVLVAEF
ncbi:serine/threonine-protein phosphatase [Nocardiopsis gilva YIM 90087]|uniref:Serine/threonine-protein phosphatase n=1 Tax=Nocardiopsis gilva YIM 90087 TaxID=1235441 RepID=A0A223SBX4_9ACTN|nr:PP2C family protein-serine/threonine phosphatase [Nocardiopsis gilva]ASU85602.1 serine/threonine-protein phosphatase [Nocardiopsis gilva YIM 90087]